LKALRHPKSGFSANCEATIHFAALTARLESRALSKQNRFEFFSKLLNPQP
jgi:hypothetical protein